MEGRPFRDIYFLNIKKSFFLWVFGLIFLKMSCDLIVPGLYLGDY